MDVSISIQIISNTDSFLKSIANAQHPAHVQAFAITQKKDSP